MEKTYTELFNVKPALSNDEFIDAVMRKAENERKYAKPAVRFAARFAVAAAALAVLAVTAMAAAGTGLSDILGFFFGNNAAVIQNIEPQPKYEIIENTFGGINFEVTGLYADDSYTFISMDITADEPVFEYAAPAGFEQEAADYMEHVEKHGSYPRWNSFMSPYYPDGTFLKDISNFYSSGKADASFIYINAQKLTMFATISDTNFTVSQGDIFTVTLSDFIRYDGYDMYIRGMGVPLAGQMFIETPDADITYALIHYGGDAVTCAIKHGEAKIAVTVPELSLDSRIIVHPDIPYDNELTFSEIRINPFRIKLVFESSLKGFKQPPNWYWGNPHLEGLLYENEIYLITKDGERTRLIERYGGWSTQADYENGLAIFEWFTPYDQTLDIQNIAAIEACGVTAYIE